MGCDTILEEDKKTDEEIKRFVLELKNYRGKIPKQVLKTIRGQAISGDLIGANKRLDKWR